MENCIRIILALLLSLAWCPARAMFLDPAHYPSDLFFLDKPIDPVCFFNLEGNTHTINLKNCGVSKDKYTVSGKNENMLRKGFYGFDWRDLAVSIPSGGYSYYKAWDAGDHQYWIYTVNSGGGSGEFTSINLYSRKNTDTVTLDAIDGGDRCNGGVEDIEEISNGIQFSTNLTAYDFLMIAKDNPHNLKPYTDLSACAACCAAKAVYRVDKRVKPALMYVEFDKTQKIEEMSAQGTYHECFNKIVSSYAAKGRNKLDETQLKQLVKEFNDTCVK